MARTPLIAGNWKMNLDHKEAIGSLQKFAFALPQDYYEKVDVAFMVPFTDIRTVQTLVDGDGLKFTYGSQDISKHESGAYTGEVSGRFLQRLGCSYVVIGHSERREHHAESDALVRSKVEAALRHELTPILCVGEPLEVREAGEHVAHTLAQLTAALDGLPAADLGGLVVAYEPVWAIGTGKTATADDAAEMCSALRVRLAELLGEQTAQSIRLLYGGSVKADNVAEITAHPDVDGALVGGASLDPDGFAALCRAATTA